MDEAVAVANPAALPLPMDRIVDFCRRWELTELALFGSALRPDFNADSDVDVLVNYPPGWRHGLFDWVRMRDELAEIFARNVDLVSRPGLERSKRASRRDEILRTARVIYHAA